MLELQDITKVYNAGTVTEQCLFHHFSLSVEDGQFVTIVGGNGSFHHGSACIPSSCKRLLCSGKGAPRYKAHARSGRRPRVGDGFRRLCQIRKLFFRPHCTAFMRRKSHPHGCCRIRACALGHHVRDCLRNFLMAAACYKFHPAWINAPV